MTSSSEPIEQCKSRFSVKKRNSFPVGMILFFDKLWYLLRRSTRMKKQCIYKISIIILPLNIGCQGPLSNCISLHTNILYPALPTSQTSLNVESNRSLVGLVSHPVSDLETCGFSLQGWGLVLSCKIYKRSKWSSSLSLPLSLTEWWHRTSQMFSASNCV